MKILRFLILFAALSLSAVVTLAQDDMPEMVNIPGTIQPAIGCSGEWAPDCDVSQLEYDETSDVWMNTFTLPAGNYEYKVALNGNWDVNYGGFADQNGANISLNLAEEMDVTFVYDDKTNWIADSVRQEIVIATGDFQEELGCESDNQADCFLTWMQDVDGDGIYSLTLSGLPAGDYSGMVSQNMAMLDDADPVTFSVEDDTTELTVIYDSELQMIAVNTGGASLTGANLRDARSHWVLADTIAWYDDVNPESTYRLIYSADASMTLDIFGLTGNFEAIDLTVADDALPAAVQEKFPHLADFAALNIPEGNLRHVPDVLKGQFAIGEYDADDNLVDMSALQIPGVLDDLYTYEGDLGVNFDINGIPVLTVWAPTALNVNLMLFADSARQTEPEILPMNPSDDGTWRIIGLPNWNGKYYLYQVEIFAPTEQAIVINEVTDPYSVSLSMNSTRSQIVNLDDRDLKPTAWDDYEKPELASFNDISLYELHIRDFSAFDEAVPEELRGTYLAFTVDDSNGMSHLRGLSAAGLTHIHLLPTFDIATINENKDRWFLPDYDALAGMEPDSEEQQAFISERRDLDPFNWGYDPYHYNVPEGSYSTNPDGSIRILEYREMVQALNTAGLRVIQDVVYNHTNSSGQSSRSVLDKIVPGYYHRLNDVGRVETSTCCQNTATEHNMMRRLMVDSVVFHATQYKVDGYRFDLMGHHMLTDMIAVRDALDALTLAEDGVDGSKIYVYGEGWNFGEVVDNARGINATQLNIAGTGMGVFNDRLRDAVRGGNPFGDQLEQGLANGVYSNPNGEDPNNEDPAQAMLFADQTRVGLAGNLADYSFTGFEGETVTGAEVDYNGAPAGYTAAPVENIVYVSAHDNETLFDAIVYKAPLNTSIEDRVRMQVLGLSYVAYAQGVPFFHAGTEILRSKSMDRNSYNSGDWFNRLDFTYQTNNFGAGLPPAADNQSEWELMQPRLIDETIMPAPEHIKATLERFVEMLQVRYSTPLFRLETAEQVMERLAFHNTGAEQIPGIIVMSISDTVGDDLDPAHDMVVVVFNAGAETLDFTVDDLSGMAFELHPVLANSSDETMQTASFDSENGTFSVPALTTAVFVLPQS